MSRLEDRYMGKLIDGEISNDIAGLYTDSRDNGQKLIEYANDNDLTIRRAAVNELFVDLDTEEQYTLFKDQLEVLQQVVEVVKVEVTPSKSGLPARHAVVTIRCPRTKNPPDGTPTMMERLALQAMLGSDRRCEILRYVRYHFNVPDAVIFLEKKQ